jgi:hypothetical protein
MDIVSIEIKNMEKPTIGNHSRDYYRYQRNRIIKKRLLMYKNCGFIYLSPKSITFGIWISSYDVILNNKAKVGKLSKHKLIRKGYTETKSNKVKIEKSNMDLKDFYNNYDEYIEYAKYIC